MADNKHADSKIQVQLCLNLASEVGDEKRFLHLCVSIPYGEERWFKEE
jgi:hypothetical protein